MIQAFFGIDATAPKASAKTIRMPLPMELFAFFLAMSGFNLEKIGDGVMAVSVNYVGRAMGWIKLLIGIQAVGSLHDTCAKRVKLFAQASQRRKTGPPFS